MAARDLARAFLGRPARGWRGEIRLPQGTSEASVRYLDGDGPAELLDQLQQHALRLLLDAAELEADGWYLRWQSFAPQPGTVHRRRTRIGDRLDFTVADDERGIQLQLPDLPLPHPWVPLQPRLQPGPHELASLGWQGGEPVLSWRYLRLHRGVALEVSWTCTGLYPSWADLLQDNPRPLDCQVAMPADASATESQSLRLEPSGEDLTWRGTLRLADDDPLPSYRRLTLDPPLVVYTDTEAGTATGAGLGPNTRGSSPTSSTALVPRQLEVEVPLRLEAVDLLARIGGRRSRLVADEDADLPFSVELVTRPEVVLPPRLPAGLLPGLPWDVAVSDAGNVDGYGPQSQRCWHLAATPTGSSTTAAARNTAASNTAASNTAPRGTWGDVHWQSDPPCFELTAVDPLPPGAPERPVIHRIARRKASVAWQLRTGSGEGELLCLTVPRWLPAGAPALPGLTLEPRGFDYAGDLRAELDGIEERFAVDQESELAPQRLYLDPDRWRFRDQLGRPIAGEALGSAGGYVRWRRPPTEQRGAEQRDTGDLHPTEWSGGSAPVLVVATEQVGGPARRQDETVRRWGGLYAPESVPWSYLRQVAPALRTGAGKSLLLTLRPEPPAIWISLWGFICRYDRRELFFARAGGGQRRMIAWVSRSGLPLFPPDSDFLLRSFSPLYAVKDDDPRRLDLVPGNPRPTLYLGRGLFNVKAGTGAAGTGAAGTGAAGIGAAGTGAAGIGGTSKGAVSFHPGAFTRCRTQLTDGGVLPSQFGAGWAPGQPVTLRENLAGRTLWLALEQPTPPRPSSSREGTQQAGPQQDGPQQAGPQQDGPQLDGSLQEAQHGSTNQGAPRSAGYLLSWDAKRGWFLRGYFAEPGATVEIGRAEWHSAGTQAGDPGHSEILPVLLSDGHHGDQGAFTITLTTGPAVAGAARIEWSDNAPDDVRAGLDDDTLRDWVEYLDPTHPPGALEPYELRVHQSHDKGQDRLVIECIDRSELAAVDQVLGVRVWEAAEGTTAELMRDAGTLRLETEHPDAITPRRLLADESTPGLTSSPHALRVPDASPTPAERSIPGQEPPGLEPPREVPPTEEPAEKPAREPAEQATQESDQTSQPRFIPIDDEDDF